MGNNTRIERLLQMIREGVDADNYPTPLNREEAILHAILDSRTHWAEKRSEQIILPKKVENARDGSNIEPTMILNSDTNYVVMFDGVKYACKPFAFPDDSYSHAIGNPYWIVGEDNGMPFCFFSMDSGMLIGLYLSNTKHTISIYDADNNKRICDDFIVYPDMLRPAEDFGYESIVFIEEELLGDYQSDIKDGLVNSELVVTFDGADYLVKPYYSESKKCTVVGNEYLADDSCADTNLPFVIFFRNDERATVFAKDNEPHMISIKRKYEKIHTIDRKFMPEAECIVFAHTDEQGVPAGLSIQNPINDTWYDVTYENGQKLLDYVNDMANASCPLYVSAEYGPKRIGVILAADYADSSEGPILYVQGYNSRSASHSPQPFNLIIKE